MSSQPEVNSRSTVHAIRQRDMDDNLHGSGSDTTNQKNNDTGQNIRPNSHWESQQPSGKQPGEESAGDGKDKVLHAKSGMGKPQTNDKDIPEASEGAEADPKVLSSALEAITDKKKSENESGSKKTHGWRDVYNLYKDLDNDWAQKINEEISTLLLFAGLFATVMTAFLVPVYFGLQPDTTQLSAPVLVDISRQLHSLSQGQTAVATTVSLEQAAPSPLRVITTALWLLSLIISLGAALVGIFVKQWVREYMRWVSIYPPQHALHIRYCRNQNLKQWHVEGTVVNIVWSGLIIGLAFFLIGLAILSFDINIAIAALSAIAIATILSVILLTTFMPVVDPNCPYRTFFSSSYLIIRSYVLRKLVPNVRKIVKSNFWQKILPTFMRVSHDHAQESELENGGRSKEQEIEEKKTFWDVDIWSEWDKKLHLSNDMRESVLVRWKTLLWLVSHQPVSDRDSLVVQCFSGLPGSSPPDQHDRNKLEQQHWVPTKENQRPRLQFECLCHMLVDSLPRLKELLDALHLRGKDLPQLLRRFAWMIDAENTIAPNNGQPSTSTSSGINPTLVKFLHSEIQGIDALTRNLLLTCISWLVETTLNDREKFAFRQIDFDLFASLLGIYFLLVDNTYPEHGKPDLYDTYHRTLVNIIIADKPNRQRLGDASDSKLSTSMNWQNRVEFVGNLLSFSSSSINFTGTRSERLEVTTIILYVAAAVRFVDYWKLKVPKQPSPEDAAPKDDGNQTGYMSTKVFWALATIVFDTGNHRWEELSKRTVYHKQMEPFIAAVQQVLEFEVNSGTKWEKGDSCDRGEMIGFLTLNHKILPHGFFDIMDKASKENILDLDEMVRISIDRRWIASPISGEWVKTGSDCMKLLKDICERNQRISNTNNTQK